jgi:hypothetical protein
MEKHQKPEHQQRKTGASNVEYNLYSEIHSQLRSAAAIERYIEDAREAGDKEVESCFKAISEQNKENVTKLRELIARHLRAA